MVSPQAEAERAKKAYERQSVYGKLAASADPSLGVDPTATLRMTSDPTLLPRQKSAGGGSRPTMAFIKT